MYQRDPSLYLEPFWRSNNIIKVNKGYSYYHKVYRYDFSGSGNFLQKVPKKMAYSVDTRNEKNRKTKTNKDPIPTF